MAWVDDAVPGCAGKRQADYHKQRLIEDAWDGVLRGSYGGVEG